jgi:hypothetical protein
MCSNLPWDEICRGRPRHRFRRARPDKRTRLSISKHHDTLSKITNHIKFAVLTSAFSAVSHIYTIINKIWKAQFLTHWLARPPRCIPAGLLPVIMKFWFGDRVPEILWREYMRLTLTSHWMVSHFQRFRGILRRDQSYNLINSSGPTRQQRTLHQCPMVSVVLRFVSSEINFRTRNTHGNVNV